MLKNLQSDLNIGWNVFLCVILSLMFSTLAYSSDRSNWPKQIRIGGASIGGTQYVGTARLGNMIQQFLKVDATTETSGGPADHIKLINRGEMELGGATAGPLYEGWNGEAWAKGTEYQNVRALIPFYPAFTYVTVLASSSVKTLKDLNGKKLGVGPRGGTPQTQFPKIFEILGAKPNYVLGTFGDIQSQLADGLIEGVAYMAALPYAAQIELEATHEARLVGPDAATADAFVKKYPYFAKGVLPAGSYKSVKVDLPTVVVWMYFITNKNMPDSLAYEITKASFEHVDYLKSGLPTWDRYMKAENMFSSPVPLHRGAVQYYREQGVKLPASLIPPEGK